MTINKRQIEVGLLLFTVLSVFLGDFLVILSNGGYYTNDYGTYLTAFLSYVSIFIFFRLKWKYGVKGVPTNVLLLFAIWLIYLVVSIVRGIFIADGYWDFKFLFLNSTLFTLIASVFYVGQNLVFSRLIFVFYIKRLFLFGFLLIPLAFATSSELYGRLMIPIGVLILFIPYISKKWKIIVIVVALTSIFVDVTFRSNIIKIGLSIGFLGIFYYKNLINSFIVKLLWLVFLVTPIILFYTALFENFNIFKEMGGNKEYTTINSQGEIENLSADTRTGLYQEVLLDMVLSEKTMFGKSPSQGYKSSHFFDEGGGIGGIRYSSEVNILNIFLYFGYVGVVLYFILIARISYLAISKSNNRISKMFGLLLASRFLLSFIEEFTKYDLNFYFFWLVMGLVSSSYFRNMTDNDIRIWLQNGPKFLEQKFSK